MLIFATLFVWPPVYYFVLYRKEKKEAIEKVRNSDEYQREYAAAKAEADTKQKLYDIEYVAAKDEFENATMPKYQAEYAVIWGTERNMPIKSRLILTGMFIIRLTSGIMPDTSKRR